MKPVDYSKFRKRYLEVVEIDRAIKMVISQENIYSKKVGYFPYIPYGGNDTHEKGIVKLYQIFLELSKYIIAPYNNIKPSTVFLDVGAGSGRMVKLAEFFGFEARGIEVQEKYVELGRKYYRFKKDQLIVKDAFDIDQEFLKDIRIIYTYMPISRRELMTKLHMHLYSNAECNTVFAEMLPDYYPLDEIAYNKYVGMRDKPLLIIKDIN